MRPPPSRHALPPTVYKTPNPRIPPALAPTHPPNHPQGSYRLSGELWIVMEYCGGGSVSDLLSAGRAPLPEELIAHICCESLKVGTGRQGRGGHTAGIRYGSRSPGGAEGRRRDGGMEGCPGMGVCLFTV